MDIAADGSDINMSVENIGEGDDAAHGLDVHAAIFHVVNAHYGIGSFERQISLQVLGRERTGRGMKIENGVGGNKQLVVDLATSPVSSLEHMGSDFNPVAILLLIDFYTVRLHRGRHHHFGAATRLY